VTLSDERFGSYLSIDLGWGLGVMFGEFASMTISGGHLNPAVSLSLALFKKFDMRKVPLYVLA